MKKILVFLVICSFHITNICTASMYEKINDICYFAGNAYLIGTNLFHRYRHNNPSPIDKEINRIAKKYCSAKEKDQKNLQKICKKLGVSKKLDFQYGAERTDAIATVDGKRIIMDGEVLDGDQNEKDFMLGHELTHVRDNHLEKRNFMRMILPFVVHYGMKFANKTMSKGADILFSGYTPEKVKSSLNVIENISNFCLVKLGIQELLYLAMVRQQERDSDEGSARTLGAEATAGGIRLFEKRMKYDEENNVVWCPSFLETHPYWSKRIAYLKDILAEQQSGNKKMKIKILSK